jgi:ribonucleoside-diphosphate reductase alpha chain
MTDLVQNPPADAALGAPTDPKPVKIPAIKGLGAPATEAKATPAPAIATPVAEAPTAPVPVAPIPAAPKNGNGNGHGHTNGGAPHVESLHVVASTTTTVTTSALDAQLSNMMGDAPFCDVCGHITVRNGACYKCLNCGNSLGCS